MTDGFIAFNPVHSWWLISIAVAILSLIVVYVRLSAPNRNRTKKVLAYSILIGELIKLIVVWQQGKSLLYYLPIHLCGLAIILLILDVYRPTALIREILFSLTLPGALIALLFPGWSDEPVMSFIHIHSFIFHAIITAYPLLLLVTGELKPNPKGLWKVGIVLLLIIPLVYRFNTWAGTNYMFLNRPIANSPLMLIHDAFGENGYIAGLLFVAVLIWLLQYTLYDAVQRMSRR